MVLRMLTICTRYRKSDATISAIAVASRLHDLARRHSIISYDLRANTVDATYDNKVRASNFHAWLPKTSHIIWTAPVDNYFIDTARREGIRSTLYTSWDQVEPYDEKVIGDYTHVLVPTPYQAIKLRDHFKLRNIAVLPFDSGIPITSKPACDADGFIRLFISLYGSQLRRIDVSAIIMLANILRDTPNVAITIGCCKGLAKYTSQTLKDVQRKYPKRWNVLWDCPWASQVIEMGMHDLTVWPARWDGFGLVGISSLMMGTPVIAWNVIPMNEHLIAGRNAVLVETESEPNWLGMPLVQPDYNEFDRVLRWVLDRPEVLAELKRHTAEGLESRRDDFRKGWNAVLPLAM